MISKPRPLRWSQNPCENHRQIVDKTDREYNQLQQLLDRRALLYLLGVGAGWPFEVPRHDDVPRDAEEVLVQGDPMVAIACAHGLAHIAGPTDLGTCV